MTKKSDFNYHNLIVDSKYDISEFNQEKFNKLTNHIKAFGQLYPIIINKVDNEYYLIDGFQRVKIFENLHLENCEVIILDNYTEQKCILLKLGQTLQSEFDVLKTAKSFIHLKEKFTSEKISKLVDFNKDQIEKYQSIYEWDWSIFDSNGVPDEIKQIQNIKNKKVVELF